MHYINKGFNYFLLVNCHVFIASFYTFLLQLLEDKESQILELRNKLDEANKSIKEKTTIEVVFCTLY